MPFRIVQSKQNPRLKQLRRALTQPLRESGSNGRVLAGIEGPNLLDEALRAGLRIECVFVAQGFEHLLVELNLAPETEVLLLPKVLLDSLLTTETPQPIAALIEPPDWTWAHFLDGHRKSASLVLVLAGLQDPGNLGTIVRSAEAFGADGVLCLPGTVSAWNPKAVRASAGSVFRLPLLTASIEECFTHLRQAAVKVWTTTMHAAEPADLVNLAGPVAFLIGNEGNGIPEELAARCNGALTIPCPGPVESLNASVAASVLLYETARQRSIRSAPLDLRGGRE
jgi:RNA methyltransferase, TrmH family